MGRERSINGEMIKLAPRDIRIEGSDYLIIPGRVPRCGPDWRREGGELSERVGQVGGSTHTGLG